MLIMNYVCQMFLPVSSAQVVGYQEASYSEQWFMLHNNPTDTSCIQTLLDNQPAIVPATTLAVNQAMEAKFDEHAF